MRKDENDNVLGVLPEALRRRPGESSISATWIEYFAGSDDEKLEKAVAATRNAQDCRPKSQFAIANVFQIKQTCASQGNKVRIVHEPQAKNLAHAAIRQLPDDDFELLELLAEESFIKHVANSSIKK